MSTASAFVSESFPTSISVVEEPSAYGGPDFAPVTPKPISQQVVDTRAAGRAIAARVSETERSELLKQRATLLRKQMTQELSVGEARRLTYVRWSLERVEDAKYGPALDTLEDLVSQYRHCKNELLMLHSNLKARLPGKKK